MTVTRYHVILVGLCLAIGALALWAYLPGLHGDFLFDDYANLPALGADGPVTSWSVFWRYLTSGQADPTGRPLALLSFLLDARDWPASPFPFKRTNLAIHLLNGALLALLLVRLGRRAVAAAAPNDTSASRRAAIAALLGAAFWLVHPLFVSTTLYVVQREAMLPATFTLLGLLLWLKGRGCLLRGHRWQGLAWMVAGLTGCTALAVLSKANGILLPGLALVLEYVLLRPLDELAPTCSSVTPIAAGAQRTNRRAFALLAWPVSAAVAGYLLYQGWHGWHAGVTEVRPWTPTQRLLTEPRVLLDYLRLLWLPRTFTPGVFNDQIQASRSLLQPLSALPALAALIGLAAGAWWLRRRWPATALAALFYLVGQALESTTIPLELYFEHRNYLPSLLLFWPLALWVCGLRVSFCPRPAAITQFDSTDHVTRIRQDRAKAILGAALLIGLALMTHARATLWGNSTEQALLWATLNPDSPRAQAYAAQAEMALGHPQAAVRRLDAALERHPGEMQLALNLLAAECQAGHLDVATMASASHALATSRDAGALLASWFGRAIAQTAKPPCPELNAAAVARLLEAARSNPLLTNSAGRRQDLYSLQGQLALASGKGSDALGWFDRALDQQVTATTAFKQAAMLGSTGHAKEALAHLDYYQASRQHEQPPATGMPRIHAWVLDRQQYWDRELVRLRNTLLADQRAQSPATR